MSWHPLAWAFGIAVATGSLLYLYSAFLSVDVAANWSPDGFDKEQLRREHHAEISSLMARGALGCLSVAVLTGLVGVALFWHRIVPGAMCGTGVLQAMGTAGTRAMIFWGLALVILYGWVVSDGLDRQSPQGGMIQTNARLMLTASPFLLLAIYNSLRALTHVDGAAPVSCCAAVYDQVLSGAIITEMKSVIRDVALWGSLCGGGAVAFSTLLAIRKRSRKMDPVTIVATWMWAMLAVVAVKQSWASYYYQVLSHPCPWCLFLADYFGVGFMIFGSLAFAVLECSALWAANRTGHHTPGLFAAVQHRCQKANIRIFAALVAYTALTLIPALFWRFSTGSWINGNHF